MTSGVEGQREVSPESLQVVLKALSNPKFRWRTISGVATETGLSRDIVAELIATEIGKTVVVAPAPSTEGVALFSTRDHIHKTASVAQKFLGAVKNRLL
jgi:hypothetical protein